MAEKSSCRCSSSYSLMRSCNASFKLSFFFSPSLARMFARWLVMFPLLRCNNSHIWLTVLSCSIKRQMFNSDGDKLGYILLIVSSLLFSFFWYAARAVKRFSLDCSPIMLNRELVFSSGLFSLNNSANANSSSFSLETFAQTKLFSVLLASKRPLITELADKLRLKYPLLPTISPCPTMRLEAIRSIIPISCRRYPKSV